MRNKFFLISFATLLIFLGTWLTPFAQEKKVDKKDYSEALRLIDIWLEAQRDYERLPGMSAAVVEDQAVIFSRAYGLADLEKKLRPRRRPSTASVPFPSCLPRWPS